MATARALAEQAAALLALDALEQVQDSDAGLTFAICEHAVDRIGGQTVRQQSLASLSGTEVAFAPVMRIYLFQQQAPIYQERNALGYRALGQTQEVDQGSQGVAVPISLLQIAQDMQMNNL